LLIRRNRPARRTADTRGRRPDQGGPLPTARLAERSGYPAGEGLDACLLGLARRGLVERRPEGFALTEAGRKALRLS
jgi:hypothetical protein